MVVVGEEVEVGREARRCWVAAGVESWRLTNQSGKLVYLRHPDRHLTSSEEIPSTTSVPGKIEKRR